MTRSPLTVAIGLICLGVDSILNTLIFSELKIGNLFHWQCDLGITATVLGQFGFQLATGIRIYRVAKVYNSYRGYLDGWKRNIVKPAYVNSKIGSVKESSDED